MKRRKDIRKHRTEILKELKSIKRQKVKQNRELCAQKVLGNIKKKVNKKGPPTTMSLLKKKSLLRI